MSTAVSRAPRSWTRVKTLIRRIHMYLGLFLLPWLLFFGISGVLFNHPNLGQDVRGSRVSTEELGELSPWDANDAAGRVLQALNEKRGAKAQFQLDPDYDGHFEGFTVLRARGPNGAYSLIYDVEQSRGVLVDARARTRIDADVFPATELEIPEYQLEQVEAGVAGLLDSRELEAESPLRLHPKIAPELRFRATDADGQSWNLTFNPRSGEVRGRKTDAFPNLSVGQIFSKMHTTHHFPMRVGPLWFWALFEDLLGLAMVVWAISGLVMWWHLKKTRLLGVVSLALALAIAMAVMGGTLGHLTFGDIEQQLGPG